MAYRIAILLLTLGFFFQGCQKRLLPARNKAGLSIREFDFKYLQGKGLLTYQNGQMAARKITAHVRMKKDSVIWMRFSLFGIVGGRALITRDSITVMSKIGNTYRVMDYATLSRDLNFEVDYALLEAILLGNLVRPLRPEDSVRIDKERWVVTQWRDSLRIVNWASIPSGAIMRVEMSTPPSTDRLTLNYTRNTDVQTPEPPQKVDLAVVYTDAKGRRISQRVAFEYNTLKQPDDALSFPFPSAPAHDKD